MAFFKPGYKPDVINKCVDENKCWCKQCKEKKRNERKDDWFEYIFELG